MKQVSYPIRPNAAQVYREVHKEEQSKSAEELQQMGFSDMLSALLGMTLSGGMVSHTLFSVLKDILPYAEQGDQRQIGKMLGMHNLVMKNVEKAEKLPHRALTQTERLLGMLRVLKKYSTKNVSDRFLMLERMICMHQKIQQGGGDLMPVVMDMMGADMGKMMQMINMIR